MVNRILETSLYILVSELYLVSLAVQPQPSS